MEAVRLRIADKYFFDNAELLLPSIKDADGVLLEDGVNIWLTQVYSLTPKTHKDRGDTRSGYDAKELNKALREKMSIISGIHKGTCVDCGALLSKGKEGFTFDEEDNIITATGELEKKLSKGIVTFSKAVDLFENNKSLFRTPVWVIGTDIDNS